MALIPRRPPRAFAGEQASGLRELYSITPQTLGIISLEKIISSNRRYNTKAEILVKAASISTPAKIKSVLYKRLSLPVVFEMAGLMTDDGFHAVALTQFVHPLPAEEVIKVLNSKYACDFTTDDLHVTHINDSYYTLEAKVNSLGYIGAASLAVGVVDEVALVPTEHALITSDTSITSGNIVINGRSVALSSPELFTQENILFNEFTQGDGTKLAYFLNLNDVALSTNMSVDISSRPAASNLNETVHGGSGNFILSAFVPATGEPNVTVVQNDRELRIASWLNTPAKIDAVFDIKLNDQPITMQELVTGNTLVQVDTAPGVMIIGNKTYNPVNLYVRAKTPSLMAAENSSFRFITTQDNTPLIEGYEVYSYSLAAVERPLENLNVFNHTPTEEEYTTLMSRVGEVVGSSPNVVRDDAGYLLDILQLNADMDDYETYIASLTGDKVFSVSIDTHATGFLDFFKFPYYQLQNLMAKAPNATLLRITYKDVNPSVQDVVVGYTAMMLNACGIRGLNNPDEFIFALSHQGNFDKDIIFDFKDTSGTLFFNTVTTLHTSRVLTSKFIPQVSQLSKEMYDYIFAEAPAKLGGITITNEDPLTIPTYLNNVNKTFEKTVSFMPTIDEYMDKAKYINVPAYLEFPKELLLFLKNSINRQLGLNLDTVVLSIINPENQVDGGEWDNIEVTAADIMDGTFENSLAFYHALRDSYIVPFNALVKLDLSNYDYMDIAPSEPVVIQTFEDSIEVFFDPDLNVPEGSLFTTDTVNVTTVINAIVDAPQLLSPTTSLAVDQGGIIERHFSEIEALITKFVPEFTKIMQVEGDDFIITNLDNAEQTLTVGVRRFAVTDVPMEYIYPVIFELQLTPEMYALDSFYMLNVGGFDYAKSDIIIDGGKYYLVYPLAAAEDLPYSAITTTVDLDQGVVFNTTQKQYTLSVDVIEAPLSNFIALSETADDDSQAALLTHAIGIGWSDPNIAIASPFDAFKTPLSPINSLVFDSVSGTPVVDGNVGDVLRDTLVGVEFQLTLTKEQLDASPNNTDVVGTITKVGTEWVMNLTREIFHRQTYERDGFLHLFLLFKVTEGNTFNGEYEIDVDWDGLNSNDNYDITKANQNSFYRQQIPFILDLIANFLPYGLPSPSVYWAPLNTQTELYSQVVGGTYSQIDFRENLLEPLGLSYTSIDGVNLAVDAILLQGDQSKDVMLFAETNITDETYALIQDAKIKLGTSTETLAPIGGQTFKNALLHYNGKYYFWLRVNVVPGELYTASTMVQIDLDQEQIKYVENTSTLVNEIIPIHQIESPGLGYALNQVEVLTYAIAQGILENASESLANFTLADITYKVITLTNLEVSMMVTGVEKPIPLICEFLGSQEEYSLLSELSTLTINGAEVNINLTTTPYFFTYGSKNYFILIVNPGIAAGPYTETNALGLDVDGSNYRFSPTLNTLTLQLLKTITTPAFVLAADQKSLLGLIQTGNIINGDITQLQALNLNDYEYISINGEELTINANYNVGAETIRTYMVFEWLGSLAELQYFTTQTTLTIGGNPVSPEAFVTNPYGFAYGGKFYFLHYMDFLPVDIGLIDTISFDYDGNGDVALPGNTTFIVNTTFTEKVPDVERISCVDVSYQSVEVNSTGKYQLYLDNQLVDITETGLTLEEIQTYLNGNNLGVAVLTTLDSNTDLIGCENSPNETEMLKISGEWDVYVEDITGGKEIIGQNITALDIQQLFVTGGKETAFISNDKVSYALSDVPINTNTLVTIDGMQTRNPINLQDFLDILGEKSIELVVMEPTPPPEV